MLQAMTRTMMCDCGAIAPNPTGRRKMCPKCSREKRYSVKTETSPARRTQRVADALKKVMCILDKVPDLSVRYEVTLCAESEIFDQRVTDGVRAHVMEEEAIALELQRSRHA